MSTKCSTCGAEIEWVVTSTGKRTPVNVAPEVIWRKTGRSMFGADEAELVRGYKSHFATCPQASQHRRKP